MIEFDCCECGRHIVAVIPDKAPVPPLCAECLTVPGWHEDPKLCAIIDPGRLVNLTINVFYSCAECGLQDIEVPVPARESEDVIQWMDKTMPLLCADHDKHSPHCRPKELSNIKIPMAGADRIGGAASN
jgi:hypothetical protein